ncbi:MAG: type II secretion system protein [Epsilonproteobacteria bacterium]|nr:type II secretion system protein [Campylobacterota bacterium]
MKKAFTLLELVFVIVVVGILAAIFIPRMHSNLIQEAGTQILSHIRYTQHLAMTNDKYNVSDNQWYLGKWQIAFSSAASTWSYRILSEREGAYNGNPDADVTYQNSEVARNPQDRSLYLIGVRNSNFNSNATDKLTQSLDLGKTYRIKKVKVTGGNSRSGRRILFDIQGRPYKGSTNTSTASAMKSPQDGLAISPLYVKICTDTCIGSNKRANNENELVIKIEHETGYACILKQNSSTECL